MIFPSKYKSLTRQVYGIGGYQIVPIRFVDRYNIMDWRNEQIFHLRQSEPLTAKMQDAYFENVVSKLFTNDKPSQILFSFLKDEECIGYGGLVHINWIDKNAEVSFVMNTNLQELFFEKLWIEFLNLIKQPAFKALNLRKIYTYAFDVRKRLYPALESAGFSLDARLREHCFVGGQYRDVLVHSFWNPIVNLEIRYAQEDDVNLYFRWANDPGVRQNSFQSDPIVFKNHLEWFNKKLNSDRAQLYVFEVLGKPIGQFRIDKLENDWVIDYSVDTSYRRLGAGKAMINHFIMSDSYHSLDGPLKAAVKLSNISSQRVFEQLGFLKKEEVNQIIIYQYQV